MAHHFAENGYLPALIGKMHFGDAHNHGSTNELYDHETDPGEFVNRINDPALKKGTKPVARPAIRMV